MWTEEGDNIVIWFVAKHKEVSRLVRLIDDSKRRCGRQRISTLADIKNDISHYDSSSKEEVLLGAFGNCPMKLYDIDLEHVGSITDTSWTPQMHLTQEERSVVEAEGTVLLLGRSGTGKVSSWFRLMELFDLHRPIYN